MLYIKSHICTGMEKILKFQVLSLHCIWINVYCPECPPGGTIGHPGGQPKKFLPFGHGRDLAAFNGTGLQNKSFQDRAEISKA